MPATENQRLVFRDKFRSLHHDRFQAWFEQIANALHGPSDFQAIRQARGDGGLDGFVLKSQTVYQVYAPSHKAEFADGTVAKKITEDFQKALETLKAGGFKTWVFVHNHPEGMMGAKGIAAVNALQKGYPDVDISILNMDALWARIEALPDAEIEKLFPNAADQTIRTHQFRQKRTMAALALLSMLLVALLAARLRPAPRDVIKENTARARVNQDAPTQPTQPPPESHAAQPQITMQWKVDAGSNSLLFVYSLPESLDYMSTLQHIEQSVLSRDVAQAWNQLSKAGTSNAAKNTLEPKLTEREMSQSRNGASRIVTFKVPLR